MEQWKRFILWRSLKKQTSSTEEDVVLNTGTWHVMLMKALKQG
jgi:hypothetical protein